MSLFRIMTNEATKAVNNSNYRLRSGNITAGHTVYFVYVTAQEIEWYGDSQ